MDKVMRVLSEERILEDYGLNKLCPRDFVETKNIVGVIQTLQYLLSGPLVDSTLDSVIKANLVKECITLADSVLEAVVISAGYRLQTECVKCTSDLCRLKSNSIINAGNSKAALFAARQYAQEINLINLKVPVLVALHDQRSNVHIIKMSETTTESELLTEKSAYWAHDVMYRALKIMEMNLKKLNTMNRCECVVA